MAADPSDAPRRFQLVLKIAVMALVVAALGLPINDMFRYALLLLATIALAAGHATRSPWRWAAAFAVVLMVVAAKIAFGVPKIEEGHNVFLPGESGALFRGLPAEVYRAMAIEFDETYPESRRCDPKEFGCWQAGSSPVRLYAFSFDGLYDRPAYSRRVDGIEFSNPLWQRLGFINEVFYSWYTKTGDVGRVERPRGLSRLYQSWRILVPHFVMFSLPADYTGSTLCWRGHVLWEETGGRFASLRHADWSCRTLTADDAERRIFGLSIAPNPGLAMRLQPAASIKARQLIQPILTMAGIAALLMLLLRWKPAHLVLPLTLVGLSLVVVALVDVSLLGGVRPLDGNSDGIVYDGYARLMMEKILNGNIIGALEGSEPVFYFTPGSRYLRLIEHVIFGESYLGYLALLLWLPFVVYALFRRYFGARCALAVALMFIAVPVGALFGSTFYIHVKHASNGFGDPAAAILLFSGIVALIGRTRAGPCGRFAPAFIAALLFALAVCARPNLSIGVAVLLGGAGLASLCRLEFARLAGLCLGILPVFSMALHNWYYGGVFVLFTQHTTTIGAAMPMPPRDYVAALLELLRLDFGGDALERGALQIGRMLLGPAESPVMAPVHAAAFVILFRVLLSARYEGWLRLLAAATLGLYSPGLFFLYSDRYPLAAWLLTLLVCFVWARDEALPWLQQRYPEASGRVLRHPLVTAPARWIDRLAVAAALVRPAPIAAER